MWRNVSNAISRDYSLGRRGPHPFRFFSRSFPVWFGVSRASTTRPGEKRARELLHKFRASPSFTTIWHATPSSSLHFVVFPSFSRLTNFPFLFYFSEVVTFARSNDPRHELARPILFYFPRFAIPSRFLSFLPLRRRSSWSFVLALCFFSCFVYLCVAAISCRKTRRAHSDTRICMHERHAMAKAMRKQEEGRETESSTVCAFVTRGFWQAAPSHSFVNYMRILKPPKSVQNSKNKAARSISLLFPTNFHVDRIIFSSLSKYFSDFSNFHIYRNKNWILTEFKEKSRQRDTDALGKQIMRVDKSSSNYDVCIEKYTCICVCGTRKERGDAILLPRTFIVAIICIHAWMLMSTRTHVPFFSFFVFFIALTSRPDIDTKARWLSARGKMQSSLVSYARTSSYWPSTCPPRR